MNETPRLDQQPQKPAPNRPNFDRIFSRCHARRRPEMQAVGLGPANEHGYGHGHGHWHREIGNLQLTLNYEVAGYPSRACPADTVLIPISSMWMRVEARCNFSGSSHVKIRPKKVLYAAPASLHEENARPLIRSKVHIINPVKWYDGPLSAP